MTLKSALQDVRETTLAAIAGLLGKLAYLASLRRNGGSYMHWGLFQVHGADSSVQALKTAHGEVLAEVLRTPLPMLAMDLRESSQRLGKPANVYAEELREQLDALIPEERKNSAAASHLSSVLLALSKLETNVRNGKSAKHAKSQEHATRLTS